MSTDQWAAAPASPFVPLPARINFSATAWFGRYSAIIRQFVTEVRPEGWTNFQEVAEWLEDHIPGNEHGELNSWMLEQLERNPALRARIMEYLTAVGMFRSCTIKKGRRNELAITGAKFVAMINRLRPLIPRLLKGEIEIDDLWSYVGHRGRTDAQDGDIGKIIPLIPEGLRAHPWIASELSRPEPEPPFHLSSAQRLKFQRWGGAFETESKLFLLALMIVLYEHDVFAELAFLPVPEDDKSDELVPELPRREYMACVIVLSNGVKLFALNAPATRRPKGDLRPTTKSAAQYRLEHFELQTGASILTVSGPTHGYRVVRTFEDILHQLRPDCEVEGMWESAGARAEQLFANALSEFIRLIERAYDEMTAALG